ncbi:unnamed protein product [Musa acuminata subsp. burmannicoides]
MKSIWAFLFIALILFHISEGQEGEKKKKTCRKDMFSRAECSPERCNRFCSSNYDHGGSYCPPENIHQCSCFYWCDA